MTDKPVEALMTILQEHFNPREEGWAWLELRGGDLGRAVLNQIEGAYDDPEAAAAVFASLIRGSGGERAFLAICRWDGQPTERDRELWHLLRREVTEDQLSDMVVFNDRNAWSMRCEDASAA